MTTPVPVSPNPDDVHKHLDLIQAVITRMSAASSNSKSWLLPVVTAAYGFALIQYEPGVARLGIGATVLFMYMDVNYLRQEKRYRRLYKAVSGGESLSRFSLDPDEVTTVPTNGEDCGTWAPKWMRKYLPGNACWTSWSIFPFYLPVVGVGVYLAW